MNFRPIALLLIFYLCKPYSVVGQSEILAEFAVHSGEHQRINAPVNVDISSLTFNSPSNDLLMVEVTEETSKIVPSQIEVDAEGKLLWWILDGNTPARTTRKFQLKSNSHIEIKNKIEIEDTKEAIQFEIKNKKILAYHYGLTPVPDGVDEVYRRGGYIHPMWSPAGEILTRIQPPDHYHHYGIWNPWTRTEFEGREIDFWNLAKGQATVVVKNIPSVIAGPVYGKLLAFHEHVVKKDSVRFEDKVALNESWEIRVWNADPRQRIWLVDFSSTITCASESPLSIKKYRYQGFSFRANKNWDDQTVTLTTSEGKNKSDANGTRARWCDVNGPSKTGTSGIVFMTHTANFNFPEQLRIWPTGMNQGKENVFVNFNPAQDRDWELEPGKEYNLKYRMMIYDGSIDSQQAENYWNDYVHPPQVFKEG